VWTCSWVFPLICRGYRRDIELEDVYQVDTVYRTRNLKARLEKAWLKELTSGDLNDEPSLFRALGRVFGVQMGFLVLLGTLYNVVIKYLHIALIYNCIEILEYPQLLYY